jgi:hypothetical protein
MVSRLAKGCQFSIPAVQKKSLVGSKLLSANIPNSSSNVTGPMLVFCRV